MKRFIMAIVCLMTMVVLSSCGDIDEDVKSSFDKFKTFSEQCVLDNAEKDAETMFKTLSKKNCSIIADSLIKSFLEKSEFVCAKSFDNLFDKYGEEKTIKAINELIYAKSYKNIKFKNKKDMYEALECGMMERYNKIVVPKLELQMADYEMKLINKRCRL